MEFPHSIPLLRIQSKFIYLHRGQSMPGRSVGLSRRSVVWSGSPWTLSLRRCTFGKVGAVWSQRTLTAQRQSALARLLSVLPQKLVGADERFAIRRQLGSQGLLHPLVQGRVIAMLGRVTQAHQHAQPVGFQCKNGMATVEEKYLLGGGLADGRELAEVIFGCRERLCREWARDRRQSRRERSRRRGAISRPCWPRRFLSWQSRAA